MDIEVFARRGFEHKRGLHRIWQNCCRGIATKLCNGIYLTDFCLFIFALLSIVVAGLPPCRAVLSHGKLAHLIVDNNVFACLRRKDISERHAVVEHTEFYIHLHAVSGLGHIYGKAVVMVADCGILTPHGSPCLILTVAGNAYHREIPVKTCGVGKDKAHFRRFYNLLTCKTYGVCRHASIGHVEVYDKPTVGRAYSFGSHSSKSQGHSRKQYGSSHI